MFQMVKTDTYFSVNKAYFLLNMATVSSNLVLSKKLRHLLTVLILFILSIEFLLIHFTLVCLLLPDIACLLLLSSSIDYNKEE